MRRRNQRILHLYGKYVALPRLLRSSFLPVSPTSGCVFVHVCKYCPSRSVELLCTQPQPTQQTPLTPLSPPSFSFFLPGSSSSSSPAPLLHSLLSHHSRLYYCIYLNHTPPRTPFLSVLYEWYKTTWLKGKILWLGVPGYWLNHTHTH